MKTDRNLHGCRKTVIGRKQMNIHRTAEEIVQAVGGAENIEYLTHCVTRLRFTLKDQSLADRERLMKTEGVLGTAEAGGIFQVIAGTGAEQLYSEIQNTVLSDKKQKNSKIRSRRLSEVLELISAALSPLVPAIMGAGFISILLALLAQFNILSSESQTYQILNGISGCVYYFFPVLIAMSLSKRLKVNQVFAVVTACFLLYPDFTSLFQDGNASVSFLGIPVIYASYSKQIIPVFLSVIAQRYIEKAVYRITPKVVRTMIASGLILTLTILVTIMIIGPFGNLLTQWLNALVYFVAERAGWAAVPIIAFLNPFFLATGLGSANFPIMLMSYVSNGYEALILPAALAGNAVQAGAGFAIALKSRNREFRSVSFECALTALMGITEPIIFSVHYRLKKTFPVVMIGSAAAALLPALTGVACYAMATGILSIPAYLPGGVMNMVYAILTIAAGIAVGFIMTMLIRIDEPAAEEEA